MTGLIGPAQDLRTSAATVDRAARQRPPCDPGTTADFVEIFDSLSPAEPWPDNGTPADEPLPEGPQEQTGSPGPDCTLNSFTALWTCIAIVPAPLTPPLQPPAPSTGLDVTQDDDGKGSRLAPPAGLISSPAEQATIVLPAPDAGLPQPVETRITRTGHRQPSADPEKAIQQSGDRPQERTADAPRGLHPPASEAPPRGGEPTAAASPGTANPPPVSQAVIPAPAQQLADGLEALHRSASEPVHGVSALPSEASLRSAGDAKVLKLKLRPEELGEVEVILRRTRHELKVSICVTREAAAEALRRDMALLEERMGVLLPAGVPQSLIILVQAGDTAPAAGLPDQGSARGQDPAAQSGQGGAPQERKTPPDKEDKPSRSRREGLHEDDARIGIAAGLVV